MMNKSTSTTLQAQILSALFAALIGISSQIAIPVGPVPITLGTFAVFLAGTLLGKKFGALSVLLYILLGAVGVPVFSYFRSGLSILISPSGGFMIGYLAAAFIIGWMTEKKGFSYFWLFSSMLLGNFVCYLFGLLWFMYLTHTSWEQAFAICIFPFIPGDVLKIGLAAFFTKKLRRFIAKDPSWKS